MIKKLIKNFAKFGSPLVKNAHYSLRHDLTSPELEETIYKLNIVNPNWAKTLPETNEEYANLILVLNQFGISDLKNPAKQLIKFYDPKK